MFGMETGKSCPIGSLASQLAELPCRNSDGEREVHYVMHLRTEVFSDD